MPLTLRDHLLRVEARVAPASAPLPITFDYTGGLRRWGWKGNNIDGDCAAVSLEDLRMAKATAAASAVERILFYVGFRPPGDPYTLDIYAAYLATLGEKPGPDVGVYVDGFLEWCRTHQPKPLLLAWARVDLAVDVDATIRALASQYTGAMLTLELTYNSYANYWKPTPWDVGPSPNDQPSPALWHEVALVRATPDFDVIATWNQNKDVTPAYMQLCARACYVVLMQEDTWRPDFAAKMAALQSLPNAHF